MDLVDRISSGLAELRHRDAQLSLNDWADYFSFGGNTYPVMQTTMGSVDQESVGATSVAGFKGNGPIFALVLARLQAFSQVRFQWTRFQGSQPTDLFGTPELGVLERPWPGGTTSDLLARMEIHASAAGCAYVTRPRRDRLSMLRPDRVTIILGSQTDEDDPSEAPDVEIAGFIHTTSRGKMTFFGPNEVAYYAPIPDPDYRFLGMSWITPVIRDLQADSLATEHKARFFSNAAPQPYDAGVLTPTGWTTMGELALGDRVFGSDGKPKFVIGVYPQGEQDIYRVTFTGGASTECTADHLWTVASAYDRQRGVTRTRTLAELMADGVRYDSGPRKWSVALADPMEFDDPGDLPMDPYLLGSLLGDGSFRSNGKGSGGVSMSAHRDDADEQQRILTPLLPKDVAIVRRDRSGWSEFYFRGASRAGTTCGADGCVEPCRALGLCSMHYQRPTVPRGRSTRVNPLTSLVRELGLFDVPGYEKSVPERYLRASVTQRIALLQGLLDTDGSVDRRQPNTVRFDSTSEMLARHVAELGGGLGAVVSVRPSRPAKGGSRAQWHVVISRLPEWINPFRLARKATVYSPNFRGGRWRYIQSVEYVGRKPAQCIGIDSDDHLYVTDDYILTHNTPNMAIKFDASVSFEKVKQFKALLESEHKGAFNAWKTLYLGGGADPVTVGSSFKDMDYAVIQGRAESRLAAAAGVPPSWVGFSEGLQGSSLNAGNFNSARRRFSDGTMVHLWTNAATSLEVLLGRPPGATLWFDSRVPFMREDAKDAAAITQVQIATIGQAVKDGFTRESAVAAVSNQDPSLLKPDPKWVSVQLQSGASGPPDGKALPPPNGNGKVAVGG